MPDSFKTEVDAAFGNVNKVGVIDDLMEKYFKDEIYRIYFNEYMQDPVF